MTRRAPLLIALGTLTAFGACSSPGGKENYPHVEIFTTYPASGSFRNAGTTCAGAESMLVSFDTDGDDRFEYRFLFDLSGSVLYGCNGPCDGPIDGELPAPRRVMIEGITVPPAEYGNVKHDVACRGIADAKNEMGSIVTSPLHFPNLDHTSHVEVPMLRVGAFNGMFTTEMPVAPAMAAALLVAEELREDVQDHLRIATGGIVVAAGGYDIADPNRAYTDVWEFRPNEIAWARAATTSTGHYYGNAESFIDANGEAAVLFVGGIGTNGRAVLLADVYRHGKALTDGYAAAKPRFFPSTARIDDRSEPAIAVLGGCFGVYERDYEFFFPSRPNGCPSPGTPGFCTPAPSAIMVEGRCQGILGELENGRLWYASGLTDDGELSNVAYVFDASAAGDYGTPVASVQAPVRLSPTIPFGEGLIAMFGGLSTPSGNGATNRWLVVDPLTGPVFTGFMREERGYNTATELLDGRVLVVAGLNLANGFLGSAEILGRGREEIGGTFDHIPPAGRTTCTPGVDCERLSEPKYAHQATRISGSATWLEGAVLITGGSVTPGAARTSELFVPAYHCDGARPVNAFDGERVSSAEFCDRLREPQRLTDPRNPKRF